MRHIIMIIALLTALSASAQTNKPVRKSTTTTSVRKSAANTTARKAPPRQRTNPAAKNPVAAANPNIKKAVNSNPQYREVSYAIHGKAHNFSEGEWVKLCAPSKNGLQATDSVQLQGEDFSFRGKTLNVPYMKYLVLGQGVKKTLVEVFIEEGNINVDITAEKRIDHVSGTPSNNTYTPYRDSINAIYTQIYDCTRESMRLTNSAEEREAYKLGADSLRRQIVTYTYSFARKNLNNWVGIYLFAEYYKRFTASQNKALLAAVPKKFAILPLMEEIRKYTKTQK